jgi:hypothetical protein
MDALCAVEHEASSGRQYPANSGETTWLPPGQGPPRAMAHTVSLLVRKRCSVYEETKGVVRAICGRVWT